MLYCLTTGRLPFPGSDTLSTLSALANDTPTPPHAINPEVPRSLSDLITRLLSKPRDGRPASAAVVVEELRRIEDALARPMSAKLPPQRGWLWAAAAAAVLLAFAGGIVVRIRNKDGSVVEIPVPPGATAEIVEKKDNPVDPKTEPLAGTAKTPLDGLRREDVPAYELAMAGNGDPLKAAPELVAVLGDSRLNHWGSVLSLSFHPDGDRIATATNDGVRVWDTASGEQRQFVPSTTNLAQTRVAYSPDGKLLAYTKYVGAPVNAEAHIILADARTGEIKATLSATTRIHQLAFSHDGLRLAACGMDVVRMWDTVAATETWSAMPLGSFGDKYLNANIVAVAFSPDGRFLAVAGDRDRARAAKLPDVPKEDGVVILDALTGKEVKSLPRRTNSLAWSHDGKYLASTAGQYDRVQVLETATWTPACKLVPSKPESSHKVVAFHPTDSDVLLIGGLHEGEGGFHVWSVSRSTLIRSQRVVGLTQFATSVAFRPDGKVAALGGIGGVFLYDTATWKPLLLPGAVSRGNVNGLAVTPDGRHLYAGGSEGVLRRWDLAGSLARPEVVDTLPVTIRTVRLDLAGKFLAVGSFFSHNYRLDVSVSPAKRVTEFPPRTGEMSLDGQRFLQVLDRNLVVLNERSEQVGFIKSGSVGTEFRAFSPDGALLARIARNNGPFVRLTNGAPPRLDKRARAAYDRASRPAELK